MECTTMIDITSLMSELASERPVFHSEADFQHALAWVAQRVMPAARVRLEYKPFPAQAIYIDVWLASEAGMVAVELKYLTAKLELDWEGERYTLKSQAAQDLLRYDFPKDVQRIERVVSEIPGATGYAVCLTNDASLWSEALRRDTVDALFRLHEGGSLTGTLSWAAHTGKGTMAKRAAPVTLRGSYSLQWRAYSQPSKPSAVKP
jgi:hypothetical protein